MLRVTHAPFHVLVANVGGAYYAIEDACPHSGRSLCDGDLSDAIVTCPGHGWELDVRTGAVLTAVGGGSSNPTFDVRLEGDVVVIYSASSSARS